MKFPPAALCIWQTEFHYCNVILGQEKMHPRVNLPLTAADQQLCLNFTVNKFTATILW